jgi:hypothetical protein
MEKVILSHKQPSFINGYNCLQQYIIVKMMSSNKTVTMTAFDEDVKILESIDEKSEMYISFWLREMNFYSGNKLCFRKYYNLKKVVPISSAVSV